MTNAPMFDSLPDADKPSCRAPTPGNLAGVYHYRCIVIGPVGTTLDRAPASIQRHEPVAALEPVFSTTHR